MLIVHIVSMKIVDVMFREGGDGMWNGRDGDDHCRRAILILAFETAAVGLFASAVSAVLESTESRLMEGAIFLLIFGSG